MKKIISLGIIALALISLSIAIFAVSGSVSCSVSMNKATAEAGETVTITVSMNVSGAEVVGLDADLSMPGGTVKCSVTSPNGWQGTATSSVISYGGSVSDAISSGGVSVTYSFTIPSDAAAGTVYSFSASSSGYDKNYNSITGDSDSCTVTVICYHDYGSWSVTTAPTTTTTGSLTRICSKNSSHIDTFTLPVLNTANGYTYTSITATCTEAGTGRYTYQKDGQTFTFNVDVPASGHDYGAWSVTTASTTTTTGTITRVCTNDSSHNETFTLPVLSTSNGYSYSVVAEATCSVAGTGRYTYQKDSQTINIDVSFPAIGHNFGSWSVTIKPSTTSSGTLTRVCANDSSHVETFILPRCNTANGYTYSEITAQTCTTDGSGRYTYVKDSQTFTFEVVIPAGHNYGPWTVTTEPSTTTTGQMNRVCSRDISHTETFTLPVLSISNGYTYSIVTLASCTIDGTGRYTYQKDGQALTFDVSISAHGHNYGAWTVTTVPTMTSTGILTRVCKNNSSHTDTAILPTLNTYGAYTYAIITQETCSATGTGRYTYVKDNQAITFNVSIPTAEHEYGKWSVKIAPNSTRTGILIRTCVNNSSHTETLTLPIIGADTGYTVTITKEPTCFETGKTEYFYRIGNQGFTFFGDLPMTEHKNTAVRDAKHATCTEEGYSGDVYCTDCDKLVLKGYVIEKIAHKFIDGVCTVCSKIDESINNDVSTVVSISTDDQGNTTYTFEVTAKNNSREVLADIKKVVGNAVHDGAGVKVNFGDVSIYFDNDAVQEINSTASASLSITKVDGSVTTEGDYRSAGFDLETCVIYEFSMAGATFNGGIATVSIPYSSDGKNVKVFYVDADGNKTEMQSTYDEATGMITFTTNHFSTYVITEIMDEIISPANYTVWIVAAVAVIIVLAVVGGIVVRKKNGD